MDERYRAQFDEIEKVLPPHLQARGVTPMRSAELHDDETGETSVTVEACQMEEIADFIGVAVVAKTQYRHWYGGEEPAIVVPVSKQIFRESTPDQVAEIIRPAIIEAFEVLQTDAQGA